MSGESATSTGVTKKALSLRSLVNEVVEWNAELINQRLNVQIGDSAAIAEAFEFEPEFFGSVKYHDTNTPNNAAETISRAGLQTHFEKKWNFIFGLSGELPLGTEWTLQYQQSESNNSVIDSLRGYTYEYETQFKASIRQPILRGFGHAANLADWRTAKLESKIVRGAYKEQLFDVVAFTIREYWKLYGAQELTESLAESVDRLAESASLAERRYESGDIAEADLIEIKSSLLARKIELRSMQNSVDSIQNQIRRLLNESDLAPADTPLTAKDDDISPQIPATSVDNLLNLARVNRALFETAELRRQQAEIAWRKKRNEARPDLDVVASTWRTQLSDDWIQETAFDAQFPSWEVGVEFSVPILGGHKARNEKAQARLQLKQAENTVEDLEREMRLRISDAMEKRDSSVTQLADMQATYELKRTLIDGELERFRAGELGITELIEKEDDATSYYRRVINKLIETKVNQANLDRETGYLLVRYGAQSEPF
ncbi:MAG: TolC family protein [Synoicihabitans sp.]